jgi:hypothetical protein
VGAYKTPLCSLGLDFMPPDQIGHMSLNGLRRRVATHDKTQTRTRMGELSIELDSKHRVSSSGAPPLSFRPLKIICWSIIDTRVFLECLLHMFENLTLC